VRDQRTTRWFSNTTPADAARDLKRTYRNPLAHGLLGERGLLVNLNDELVPISYEFLRSQPHHGAQMIDVAGAKRIVAAADEFLSACRGIDPYRYAMIYVESGLAIPVRPDAVDLLRDQMTSPEGFKDFVDGLSAASDARINREG